ncbi:MAG TPA: hypothetical protein V6D16_01300 [Candidatus Obscuribacterales bacterium]
MNERSHLLIVLKHDRQQLRLLSECPNCRARFKIPALLVDGHRQRCFMTFAQMTEYHQAYF